MTIDITYLNGEDVERLALTDDEAILFWHRGLGITDIALGHALLEKAKRAGIGQQLRYA